MTREEYERRMEDRKLEYDYNRLKIRARNRTISHIMVTIVLIIAAIYTVVYLFMSAQGIYDVFVVQKQENEEYEIYKQHQLELKKQEEEQLKIDNENKKKAISEEIKKIEEFDYITIKTIDFSATDSVELRNIVLSIDNILMPDNEETLCHDLEKVCEILTQTLHEYGCDYDFVDFEFTEDNPYSTASSGVYSNGGYIRKDDWGYHVYLHR